MTSPGFHHDSLAARLGQRITLSDDQGNSVSLSLDRLACSSMHGPEWESFALIMVSDEPIAMTQGVYRIAHPELGEHDLFVSPKSYSEFEIVINRRRSSPA